MITIAECAEFAGLSSNEIVLGVIPAARHRTLLMSYLLNLDRGFSAVRDMIMFDMRQLISCGALNCAADLLIVLRLFFSEFPEACSDKL